MDIGCGDGKVTTEIAVSVPNGKVVGIDSSADMIELAKKKFSNEQDPNLEFHIGDASDLKFNNEFDIVFSNAALHWVKNHKPVATGIRNALKQRGRILLQMGGKGNAESILSLFDILLEKENWKKYFTGFEFPYFFPSDEEYKIILKDAGLVPLRIELIPRVMTYEDSAGLSGWLRTTWLPYLERLPENLKETFVKEIVDLYISKFHIGENAKVSVNMIRLEIEAVKE